MTTVALAADDFVIAINRPLPVILRSVIGGTFCSLVSVTSDVAGDVRLKRSGGKKETISRLHWILRIR